MYNYISIFFCLYLSGCVAKVSNLVVFGDSYSDVGNRWQSSNGPGWSQDLAAGWNASLYSFAFSGATCDRSVNGTPSIIDQVEMYYHQHLDLPPEETVYAFWVGHDDIHEAIQANKSGMKLKR
ncbi:hypothetical protein [Absidia glauca]|uniref:SGNH hydrolase-type esterase domain-containing protein n=1 Tax=Absidia glauca TaxID=4829 RepID=A0A163JC21_ABSGL|nr:hypothetical protein [Absidia glauca]